MDVKKKRGRKPKNATVEPKTDDMEIISSEQPVVDVKKNKRGRKPKMVYNANEILVNNPQSSLSDEENIIVRLNVVDDDLSQSSDEENIQDHHPYAYNHDEYCNITELTEIVDKNDTKDGLKIVSLLKDFEEKNKVNEWPTNTSICCYWCCHKFLNAPFGIPINYTNNAFEVFGCFCSLECAAAYNFKMQDNIDEMWERYNLINVLCRHLNIGKLVKPAPDKLTLKMFGGYLDIEEFRSFFKSNKLININFPPMTSLTQQIEEINEHEINSEYRYIPLDHERIDKYREKTLIKRNKPLNTNKTSLETTMNLKYV